MKSILFITSTNLASNPRLAKELHLAANNGYKTSVVQFYFENWSDHFTSELEKRLPDTSFYNLSAGRNPFFPWFLGSVLSRLFRIIPKRFQTPFTISIITGKRSLSLLKWVRAHKKNYTIVVAHNPPSFYPAYIFSKRTGAKLGIDIEDYHPGETCIQKEQWYMGLLMKFTLPFADYCSYAAALIAQQVNEDIQSL